MRSLVLCALFIVVANAAEAPQQQHPEYVEDRIADKLKTGIDAAAGEVTDIRQGVRNLKEGAKRKISDAAEAVESAGDNAKNVVFKAEEKLGGAVMGVKKGISNAYHGTVDSVGQDLIDAGRAIQGKDPEKH